MAEGSALVEKREELKQQLAADMYQWQLHVWVERTGNLLQRLMRKPDLPSYWLSAIALIMLPVLIDAMVSFMLGEFQKPPRRELFLLELAFTGAFLVLLVTTKLISSVSFTTLSEHLLDYIKSMEDLDDLQKFLKSLRLSRLIFYSLCFGICMAGFGAYMIFIPRVEFISPGARILILTTSSGIGIGLCHLFQYMFWEIRLGRYQLKLYESAPSHSEIIDRLSGMNRRFLYLQAIIGVAFTLVFTSFGLTTRFWIILLIVTVWGPIIVFFIIGQVSLSNIIINAKRQKLNQIQARIEKLEMDGNIEDKDTMETIQRLIEYHNQILGTPNSALNLRAGLNFLNSLLLPLIAFVLGNLDLVLGLFSDKP